MPRFRQLTSRTDPLQRGLSDLPLKLAGSVKAGIAAVGENANVCSLSRKCGPLSVGNRQPLRVVTWLPMGIAPQVGFAV